MKFIVLSKARSGSTWLVNTIGNIEGFYCFGELFLQKESKGEYGRGLEMPQYIEWARSSGALRPFKTFKYLDKLFRLTDNIGFKLMWAQQRRYAEILIYAALRKISVIHLIRRNGIDALISLINAKSRGKFHYTQNEKTPIEEAVQLDPANLLKELERLEKRTKFTQWLLKILRIRHIEVFYEDLLKGPEQFRPVWDFLCVNFEKNPPSWEQKKIRTRKLLDIIENYDEVEKLLRDSAYAGYLS